ncbi:transposase [Oceanispirochaeta sp. M1]|uniref:transposase n=1 Tax=unclassified Oceanispirochaeta TaxID=2635722 RepID=UPI0018F42DD8
MSNYWVEIKSLRLYCRSGLHDLWHRLHLIFIHNPERLKNEAALASMCGVNPLPASSGKITRHPLNRGGSRIENNALWTMSWFV